MKKLFLYTSVAMLTLLSFAKCTDDIDKLKDSIRISITTPTIKSYVHFEFIDAETGKYITDENVIVKLSGKDADKLYSTLGERNDSYTSVRGMVDFIVDPKLNTDNLEDNPLEIIVSATTKKSNYAEYLHRLVINDSKNITIRVPLVNKDNMPEGISKSTNDKFVTTKNGVVQSAAVAMLNSGTSTVEVAAGTILKDAAGNVINGNIKSDILFYDPSSEKALYSFPGGLDVRAVLSDGNTADINFSSAGLFDINLSAGGNKVRTFEGGSVKLKTQLDPALINPDTEQPIKEGDEIEMWSMNPETMVWEYEKTAKVKSDNGGLYLEEMIDHLSYWNWDWKSNSCSYGAKIVWEGNVPNSNVTITNMHPMNYYGQQNTVRMDPNHSYYNNVQFLNVPERFPTTFTFKSSHEHITFNPARLTIKNLCDQKPYIVKVTDNRTYYNIDLDMILVSIADTEYKKTVRANAFFYIKPEANPYYDYTIMENGIMKTSITVDTTYDIFGYLGNNFGQGKLRIEEMGNKVKVLLTPEFVFNDQINEDLMDEKDFQVRLLDKPASGNYIQVKDTIKVRADVFKKLGM